MKEINTIDEMKAIQLEIMDKIHCFCESNDIVYYLSHGSLIGALRHNGFIPWDDDIDIFMFRDDYEKFCECFPLIQDDLGLELVNSKSEKYYGRPMSKVIDKRTILIEPNYTCDDEIGVNVDIWPLDGVPDNEKEFMKHKYKVVFLLRLLYGRIIRLRACNSFIQKVMHIILMPFPPVLFLNRIEKLLLKCKIINGKSVSCYVDPYKSKFEKAWFSERKLASFEGRFYYVPVEADKILRVLYGDYMQLPPIDKQKPHHVTNAFWK